MAEPRVLRDLRVLRPEPRGVVLHGDPPVAYPILSVVDLKRKALHELLALDNPATGEDNGILAQGDRLTAQIKMLCPTMPADIVDEMTFREKVDFHAACLDAGPPPLVQSLAALLRPYPVPCEEACEHPDCPALRELWAMKEKLSDVNPTTPAPPARTAPEDSSTVSASST